MKDLFMLQLIKGCQMSKQFLSGYKALSTTSAVLNRSKFDVPERFAPKNVVFNVFRDLVKKYNATDLGEGYPDYPPPGKLTSAVACAATSDDYKLHHYAPTMGHPRLLEAVAEYYSRITNCSLDPSSDVIITVGATQALYVAFQTHTLPGDEWIIFEPFYSYYLDFIKAAEGTPRYITLRKTGCSGTSADWIFNREELSCLFNEKTKGIVLNNPHNPVGKVFLREELEFIACLAKKWNTLVISDESYEFLTYDQIEFIRIATLPDMFERTITISSSSKAFRATGYRVGWAYGDPKILNNLKTLLETNILAVVTPIQEGLSVMLEEELRMCGNPSSYLMQYRKELEKKRNFLVNAFNKIGLEPIVPQGGYFIAVDCSNFQQKFSLNEKNEKLDNFWFVKWMIKELRILGLPLSGFYSDNNKHLGDNYLRFTLCKKNVTLQKVSDKLSKWSSEHVNT